MSDQPDPGAARLSNAREAFKDALRYRRDYDTEYPSPAAETYIANLERALAEAEAENRALLEKYDALDLQLREADEEAVKAESELATLKRMLDIAWSDYFDESDDEEVWLADLRQRAEGGQS